jgi:hypothetical protein
MVPSWPSSSYGALPFFPSVALALLGSLSLLLSAQGRPSLPGSMAPVKLEQPSSQLWRPPPWSPCARPPQLGAHAAWRAAAPSHGTMTLLLFFASRSARSAASSHNRPPLPWSRRPQQPWRPSLFSSALPAIFPPIGASSTPCNGRCTRSPWRPCFSQPCSSLFDFHGRPAPMDAQKFQQRAPFLAVRRGARRLFDKMRSKPRAAAALPFDLHSPRRVSSLSCSLRSPIRDAVGTRGEKTSLPLLLLFFCVLGKNVELLRVSNRS